MFYSLSLLATLSERDDNSKIKHWSIFIFPISKQALFKDLWGSSLTSFLSIRLMIPEFLIELRCAYVTAFFVSPPAKKGQLQILDINLDFYDVQSNQFTSVRFNNSIISKFWCYRPSLTLNAPIIIGFLQLSIFLFSSFWAYWDQHHPDNYFTKSQHFGFSFVFFSNLETIQASFSSKNGKALTLLFCLNRFDAVNLCEEVKLINL